ncbi:hypothetical protein [Vibrio sp. K4]|uniref:hypothetical protein n=1 Tax=Vibrio sp. K4 TaxID=3391579 RepID=UPI003DA79A00
MTTINAHQLMVGMTIRCPIDGDIITISDLIANSESSLGLGCDKGYTSVDVNDTFELVKPFDLTKANLNWISEQLTEIKETHINEAMRSLAWGTEQDADKAEIEITPYCLNRVTYELIHGAEPISLKKMPSNPFLMRY